MSTSEDLRRNKQVMEVVKFLFVYRPVAHYTEREIKMHLSILTHPHPQCDSCSCPAQDTGILYRGCTGTSMNKGQSLLAKHAEDGQTCRWFANEQRNLLDYYLKFKGHVMYLKDYHELVLNALS